MSSLALDASSPDSSRSSTSLTPSYTLPEDADDEDQQDEEASPKTLNTATGSGRTRLSRSSKSDCLLRMNRRVVMKPQRKNVKVPKSQSDEDIKRFYLNNKLGSAASRQNNLETIFEEPSVVRNELRLLGLKKLKRNMTCKDGLNIPKATVLSRRKKIKSLFGAKTKYTKVSMDAFLEHLQSMRDGEEENEHPSTAIPNSIGGSSSSIISSTATL